MVAGTKAALCSLPTPSGFLINQADGLTRDTSHRLALAVHYEGPREPSSGAGGAALALTPSDKPPPPRIRQDVAEPLLLPSDELYLKSYKWDVKFSQF